MRSSGERDNAAGDISAGNDRHQRRYIMLPVLILGNIILVSAAEAVIGARGYKLLDRARKGTVGIALLRQPPDTARIASRSVITTHISAVRCSASAYCAANEFISPMGEYFLKITSPSRSVYISSGSPSRIRIVRLISFGITSSAEVVYPPDNSCCSHIYFILLSNFLKLLSLFLIR